MKQRLAKLVMLAACMSALIPTPSAVADHAFNQQAGYGPAYHFRNTPIGEANCEHVLAGQSCLVIQSNLGNSTIDSYLDAGVANLNQSSGQNLGWTNNSKIPYLWHYTGTTFLNDVSPPGVDPCVSAPGAENPQAEHWVIICFAELQAAPYNQPAGVLAIAGPASWNSYAAGRYHMHVGRVLVDDDTVRSAADWKYLFAHELGHVLGLRHRGVADTIEGHPNDSSSVMSYSWTTPTLDSYDRSSLAQEYGVSNAHENVDTTVSPYSLDDVRHMKQIEFGYVSRTDDYCGAGCHRFIASVSNRDPYKSDLVQLTITVNVYKKSTGAFLNTLTFPGTDTTVSANTGLFRSGTYQAPTAPADLQCFSSILSINSNRDNSYGIGTITEQGYPLNTYDCD